MHEYYVTEQIIKIASESAAKEGIEKITAINVVIGDLTGIVDDSVNFYFDLLAADTPAAGSKLFIRRIPAMLRCPSCSNEYERDKGWECPVCGVRGDMTGQGREFFVESIECEE
jgi:hydrogenase nickel incorporation protein HypA/HybF